MYTKEQQTIILAFQTIQDQICQGLEMSDGKTIFQQDLWDYQAGQGGGRTRVLSDGAVFEQAGVNFSALKGTHLPKAALEQFNLPANTPFFATGVSLVIHPKNPYVPTTHMNIRYFEAGTDREHWWFGGGIDVTPYYPELKQVIAFHQQMKNVCDQFNPTWYAKFKDACDRYFFLHHRNECRGIGGIFYDHMNHDFEQALAFTRAVGQTFLPAYLPFVDANKTHLFGERERQFQLYRRGRYVEFNLLWDRGTKFGIESGGRAESILMSLPPLVRWGYQVTYEPGTPEAALTDFYLKPQDWLGFTMGA